MVKIEKKVYSKRILAYIDILGFKDLTCRSVNDKELFDIIQKCLGKMNTYFENDVVDRDFFNTCDFQCVQFSDTIVASIDSIDDKREVRVFFNKIMALILYLTYKGILSRGAIVYEYLYHNKDIIFGPGIIEAYFREQTRVFFPRIIIDDKVVDLMDEILLDSYSSTDIDGVRYVDCMRGFWKFDCKKNRKYHNCIKAHLNKLYCVISNGVTSESLSVRQKYEWLRSKYNSYIDSLTSDAINNIKSHKLFGDISKI